MGYTSVLLSPKKEEERFLENWSVPKSPDFVDELTGKAADMKDEFEGILGIGGGRKAFCGQLSRDFMDWEEGMRTEGVEESDQRVAQMGLYLQDSHCFMSVKSESCGFWDNAVDYQDKKVSLNLSLNYQEVLDAWFDRGSLFADECTPSMATCCYKGEVPVMEEDRTRREASVQRYKEKRHSRLFSKKIRYQVRKLNADNRPRLKGRFVKRVTE